MTQASKSSPPTPGTPGSPATGSRRAVASGTVWVVSEETDLRDLLRDTLAWADRDHPVQQAADILSALGELGRVDSDPLAVVIDAAALEHEEPGDIAGALGDLAPGARLLLIAPPRLELLAARAVHAGFDAYLVEPVEPATLAQALGWSAPQATESDPTDTTQQGEASPHPGEAAHAAEPTDEATAPATSAEDDAAPGDADNADETSLNEIAITHERTTPPRPAETPAHLLSGRRVTDAMQAGQDDEDADTSADDPPLAPPHPTPARTRKSSPTPAPAEAAGTRPMPPAIDPVSLAMASVFGESSPPTPVDDAELGDVDLIAQLMHDPRGLRDMAIRLVRGQLQQPSLGWAPSPDKVPASHRVMPVNHQGQSLGCLHGPRAVSATLLERWAAWLGHWLAMSEQWSALWDMAMRDQLTGAWNRRYFDRFLEHALRRATLERRRVTVMVYDIDDFKSYNDRFGHAAGDEILRETARLMQSVVRDHDVVARIGGDEFAVIFWEAQAPRRPHSEHPQDVRQAAERFRKALRTHRFPRLLQDVGDRLTISGGLAGFPWDGRTPQDLLEIADQMALQSKHQGKNAITFGPGALRDA